MYINKGEDITIRHRVTNPKGGTVDLTGASIYAYLRASADASTFVFQKRNEAAGGSDSEIEVVNGECLIKIDRANSSALTLRTYYLEIYTVISGADYVQGKIIRVSQNKTGGGGTTSTTPQYLTIGSGITGDIDDNNTTFTISVTPAANTFFLFRNGVKQILTTDYTLTGTTLEMVTAPETGDILEAYCDA